MKSGDNNLDLLTSAIKELSNVNYKIEEFNKTIYKLSENLKILMNVDMQEDIAIAAKDVNDALLDINERYSDFLKENNITENLNNSLEIMKNSLSSINRKVDIIQNKSILKENVLDDFSKEINNHTTNQLEEFKKEIIRDIKNEYKNILNENINTIVSDNVVPSNTYGEAFYKDDSIYYISKTNGNRIHKYNIKSKMESIVDITSVVNGQQISIKPPKSIKISYAHINNNESYLLGIDKRDRSLYYINFETSEYKKLARYCIDFEYFNGYVYVLVHNNIGIIQINPKITSYTQLLHDEEITESKGSLSVINNNIFINFNEYNFIVDVKTSKLINIL